MNTLLKHVGYLVVFGACSFGLGFLQNSDAQWRETDLAAAQTKGYHAGYNQGSSAGLVAAHSACISKLLVNPTSCDWLLANAVVAYADEVK